MVQDSKDDSGLASLQAVQEANKEEIQKKVDKLKQKLDQFKDQATAKFNKYIIGITLLPPKDIEKEKKLRPLTQEQEDKLKKEISILVLVDDTDVKKMSKLELINRLNSVLDKIASSIDQNFYPDALLLSELTQDLCDGKYDLLRLISLSAPVHDPKDLLAALKIAEVHKSMVLKKFEKYVTSYIVWGSLFRGEKANDIDVAVIIDDTDVKKMSRLELKERLRAMIAAQSLDAADITKIQKKFHVQVYILTDFWEGIKDANPVFFTALRDGVPLYDKGVFMPWKLLLQMGRIKPSPEAIDMFMNSGDKIIQRAKFALLDILEKDIYWAVLTPTQAALMLYGIAPPTPKETIQLLEEIFVKKEKLLEKKYVIILEKIRRYYKDLEHGKIKYIKGKEIDTLLEESETYLKRIKKLFSQIEKKREKESLLSIYDNVAKATKELLTLYKLDFKKPKLGIKKLIDLQLLQEEDLSIYNEIIKAYNDYRAKKLKKQEVDKAIRESRLFLKSIHDVIQLKNREKLLKATLTIKYENKLANIIFFKDKAYLLKDLAKSNEVDKSVISKNSSLAQLQKSSPEELESSITKEAPLKELKINQNLLFSLEKIFGKNLELIIK